MQPFENPYKPGAGHMPPHLAGRAEEVAEFDRLLTQDTILENMILTGLRGVGKTVLLETLKPRAVSAGWLWAGTDMSEAVSISEENLALRMITDLAVATAGFTFNTPAPAERDAGFLAADPGPHVETRTLNFETLAELYNATPGLTSDKLKAVLEFVGNLLGPDRPVVFAYDEAQNLTDHAQDNQFPLSLLLDVFQSLQRKEVRFMLVLSGLPTLFPKLIDARTFAERMFRVVTLDRLDPEASRDAITKPIDAAGCPVRFNDESVDAIVQATAGYPYFIQFFCRECFDVFIRQVQDGKEPSVPIVEIQLKLDTDFFAGRWSRATDRQRELLWVIAGLGVGQEWAIKDVVQASKDDDSIETFGTSAVNQMLKKLGDQGLIYKNRFGRYSLAVPLLDDFIRRTYSPAADQ